jgi:hypothetical protein
VNGNRYISLAETDKGIRDVINLPTIFDLKPVIMRAFMSAKTALKASSKYGDDYVSRAEFKYLLAYLKQYFAYWLVFAATDSDNDRRISREEFSKGIPILKKFGINFKNGGKEAFDEID